MSELQRRGALEDEINEQAKRLNSHTNAVRYYTDSDWPLDEPIGSDIHSALAKLNDAICALDTAITQTKRRYRQRVLSWLLAETEAS